MMPPEHLRPENAERQLAGAVLRDPDLAVDAALRHIGGADDFYHHTYRLVFATCQDLHNRAQPGGPQDVYEVLVRRGQAADLGPHPGLWLSDLFTEVPSGANVDYYALQVREAALRRRLWHAAQVILRDTEAPPVGNAEEALAQASGRIQDLLEAAAGRSSSVVPLNDLLHETLAEVEARHADPTGRIGVSSGFDLLDALIGGFRPGQLIVVGARPAVGKTAWLLAMLSAIARSTGPTFLASLEMPRQEIGERLLAMGASVRLNRIRSGRLDRDDVTKLAAVTGTTGYGGAELFVDDRPSITTAQFGATVRTMVRRHGVKLAALDYLQLLQPADRRANRVQQVGQDSRDLKLIARQCGIPILTPCQLNRAIEGRPDGAPRLSDLRESGAIEQDADTVIMLHVPPGQDDDAELLRVEAHVRKNRHGATGKVTLAYRRPVVRFENAAVGC